ncbi:uncharacterized protein A4U43_C03F32180 [Asparagus officinalis]|uniref:Uncharacterized protein n=1 Tax=Asparagus officinalis TaxID=4686 RepID=A0A5P1FJG3_ASPOF|nr:uncharacterized protein A4U43_C03F32180 [Asparagus officinalis]
MGRRGTLGIVGRTRKGAAGAAAAAEMHMEEAQFPASHLFAFSLRGELARISPSVVFVVARTLASAADCEAAARPPGRILLMPVAPHLCRLYDSSIALLHRLVSCSHPAASRASPIVILLLPVGAVVVAAPWALPAPPPAAAFVAHAADIVY